MGDPSLSKSDHLPESYKHGNTNSYSLRDRLSAYHERLLHGIIHKCNIIMSETVHDHVKKYAADPLSSTRRLGS